MIPVKVLCTALTKYRRSVLNSDLIFNLLDSQCNRLGTVFSKGAPQTVFSVFNNGETARLILVINKHCFECCMLRNTTKILIRDCFKDCSYGSSKRRSQEIMTWDEIFAHRDTYVQSFLKLSVRLCAALM